MIPLKKFRHVEGLGKHVHVEAPTVFVALRKLIHMGFDAVEHTLQERTACDTGWLWVIPRNTE